MRLSLVITAGPTREHLDPVRFLSNPSTGKMGFALAAEAARRGHDVTLIAGPVVLPTPSGVRRVDVVSAREMLAETERAVRAAGEAPVVIATAAVADWRPAVRARRKLKKGEMASVLKLVRNPDILKTLAARRRSHRLPSALRLIGFAAETDHVRTEAARKCHDKGLAFIVANDVTQAGSGFGSDTNQVTLLFPDGTERDLPLLSKRLVARRILETVEG